MGSIFVRFKVFGKAKVAGLLGEVERLAWASGHVAVPQEARRLFGLSFKPLLESIQCQAAEAREVTCRGVSRRIRETQGVVMGIIASLPLEAALCRTDSATHAYCERWLDATTAGVRARWGEDVVAAYAHEDEFCFHVHFIVVPHDAQMLARTLHPGLHAKREAENAARRDGMDAATARRAGSTANTAALNRLLDEYHHDVGRDFSLARTLGGKGSAPPWVRKALKKAAAENQRLAIEAEGLRLAIASARTCHAEIEEDARQLAAQVSREREDVETMREAAQKALAEAQARARLLTIEANRAADRIRNRVLLDAESTRTEAATAAVKAQESLAEAEAARRRAVQATHHAAAEARKAAEAAAADRRDAALALEKAGSFGARVAVFIDVVAGHGRQAADEVRAAAEVADHEERRLRKAAEELVGHLLARQRTLRARLAAAERFAADEQHRRQALEMALEQRLNPRIPEKECGPRPGPGSR